MRGLNGYDTTSFPFSTWYGFYGRKLEGLEFSWHTHRKEFPISLSVLFSFKLDWLLLALGFLNVGKQDVQALL
jgi:hypothetical protein